MRAKDILIGFAVLVVLIAGILLVVRIKNSRKVQQGPISTPNFQQIESKFPALPVPENADRAELLSVSADAGMGEAWRTFENGKFNLTIMADLPAPSAGHFYQGWISNGKSLISLGGLGTTKGGYLVNFSENKNYSSYNKVVVTLEKLFDGSPEEHVLEGSF